MSINDLETPLSCSLNTTGMVSLCDPIENHNNSTMYINPFIGPHNIPATVGQYFSFHNGKPINSIIVLCRNRRSKPNNVDFLRMRPQRKKLDFIVILMMYTRTSYGVYNILWLSFLCQTQWTWTLYSMLLWSTTAAFHCKQIPNKSLETKRNKN